jgi:AraC-like DNA-binding protein
LGAVLVAHLERRFAGTWLLSTPIFARGLWANVVQRSGLTLDTRWVPADRHGPRPGVCLYLLLQGRFAASGAGPDVAAGAKGAAPQHVGPVALVLTEEHLDGAGGARPLTLRLEGEPFVACELHFDADDVTFSTGKEPCVVALHPDVWGAASRLAAAGRAGDRSAIAGALRALLVVLGRAGHVAPRVVDAVDSPLPFEALWRAVVPLAESFALSPTVDEVGSFASLSNRHMARQLRSFFDAFLMVGGGFRPTLVHYRVKAAVLFLSAREARVGDVAKLVGYGSAEAMSHAFRDAGLPSPSAVRAALAAAP